MSGMQTKPTTLLRHDPRSLGLVPYALRLPRAEPSPQLTDLTIRSNPTVIILAVALSFADPLASCCGMRPSQRRAGGIC
jgi:hypothetical protein